jgi:putative Holliday junction resolvase
MASPLGFLHRTALEEDIARVLEFARKHGVERIVVGMPLSLSGEPGPQAERVRGFLEALRSSTPLPVEAWDERLSTAEAERLLREAGVKPSREKGRRDAASAAVILQSYLDSLRAAG